LPVPTRTGYTFAGWFEDEALTTAATDPYTATEDVTLYAKWDAETYRITYDYNDGTGSPAFEDYTVGGSAITLPVPTRTGYTFAGWFEDEALTTAATDPYTATEDVTLYAKWDAHPTLVSSIPADNASGVAPNANLELTFSENVKAGTGYIFIMSSSDGSIVAQIEVGDTSQVTFAGDTVTVNPEFDLSPSTGYYVLIDPGAILDLSDNEFAGITNPEELNFTTAAEERDGTKRGHDDKQEGTRGSTTPMTPGNKKGHLDKVYRAV
jgi:uncharacterized repeat protein (TIGR02543 family)